MFSVFLQQFKLQADYLEKRLRFHSVLTVQKLAMTAEVSELFNLVALKLAQMSHRTDAQGKPKHVPPTDNALSHRCKSC